MTIDDRFKGLSSIPKAEVQEDSAVYRAMKEKLKPVAVFSQREEDEMASERNASAAALHRKYVLPSNRYEGV
ncbi:MAG: hypothetical protein V2A62_00615 [Candidatus Woesearchaeota archaeon]